MKENENAILDTIHNFLDCYAKKDVKGCMSLFSEEKKLLMLGTNEKEVFTSRAMLQNAFDHDFENLSAITFGQISQSNIEANEKIASTIIELPIAFTTKGGEKIETLFRYALTLCQEKGEWKICAGMTSIPFNSESF